MKKTFLGITIFLLFSSLIFGQEGFSLVKAFQRNYVRGSLATKIEVLQDSVSHADEDMRPLYLQSLSFVTVNADFLANDNLARELTALTVRLIGVSRVEEAALSLWNLFGSYNDEGVKREILSTLGDIAGNTPEIISTLNRWVDGRNNLFRAGQDVEFELLGEAITSLGKLGDETSFAVIFRAAMLDYPEPVSGKTEEALKRVKGDYQRMVASILQGSPLREKLHVLNFVADKNDIPDEDKSWIAANALEIAIYLTPQNRSEQEMIFQLKEKAVGLLMLVPNVSAVPDLIKHFDNTILAWERELVSAFVLFSPSEESSEASVPGDPVPVPSGWEKFDPEKVLLTVNSETPVFLAFSAQWCLTCKTNERTTLLTDWADDFFKSHGITRYYGDYTNNDPVIAEWIENFGRAGVPVYIFFPPRGEPILLPEVISKSILEDRIKF